MVKSKQPPRSGSSLEAVEAVIILKTWGILWGDANKNTVQEKLFHSYLKKWSWSFRKEFFFLSWFSFADSRDSRGTEGTIFIPFCFLPPPHAHKHSDIYLHFCMWDDCHVFFNHAACNYQTAAWWDLPPSWITISLIVDGMLISCLLYDLILDFVTVISTWESRWFELAATITLLLQVDNGL